MRFRGSMITDFVGSYTFAQNRSKGIKHRVQQELSTRDLPQIIRQNHKQGKHLLTVGCCQKYLKRQFCERNPKEENLEG